MERRDQNMPFLLRYENVAWYENGKVRILDRRVYPTEVCFVECATYQEVAQAIADMVTQSAGPYTAVGMGMALAPAWAERRPSCHNWQGLASQYPGEDHSHHQQRLRPVVDSVRGRLSLHL